jgi:BirA family biotin operon repressor/biotin-[acetyl-CoA-carboxylase] ligase
MSVILKQEEVSPLMVTTAAAVAVCRAIEEVCGKQPEIKWVNDIYLNGKKICGILAEAVTDHRTGRITHIIAGIGINCDPSAIPDELTDIAGAIDGDFSASRLAAHVLNNLLELTESQDTESIISSYRDRSMVLGKTVTVYKGGYSPEAAGLRARVLDIAGDGGLVVLYSDGSQEKLSTGEISIRL